MDAACDRTRRSDGLILPCDDECRVDNFVRDELTTWGPEGSAPAIPSLLEAEAYCRRLAIGHYENFPVVSWLLPKELRQPFYNVYAYCRWSDDLGDEVGSTERARQLLNWWRGELLECYEGRARHPVFVALGPTIREYNLPRDPFEDLISAFEQDQVVTAYDTFEQLRDYCRRSADPVGRLVLHLCRCATPDNINWSDSICTGLQLANFWQDVSRDQAIGRIYLPREDRERFGYSLDDWQARRENPAFLQLMKYEVDRARQWLSDGWPLISRMPGRLQVDIELFLRGGLTILQRIEQMEYRVWSRRPVVGKLDVLRLFVTSLASSAARRTFGASS